MAAMSLDAILRTAAMPGAQNFLAEPLLMQHEMPARAQRRHRPRLLRLASADGFAESKKGTGQIEVYRFLRQHGQALKYVGCCRVRSRFRQIVVNHGWRDLCRLSHPSVR